MLQYYGLSAALFILSYLTNQLWDYRGAVVGGAAAAAMFNMACTSLQVFR